MKFRIIKTNNRYYPQRQEMQKRSFHSDEIEYYWTGDFTETFEQSFDSYDEAKSLLDNWIEKHKINIVYEREDNVDRWHYKKC